MRRSPWLVAIAAWLLWLPACTEQPSPRSPARARAERHTGAVSEQPPASGDPGGPGVGLEPARLMVAADGRARGPANPSSSQLAQRFARAPALASQRGSASYYSDVFAGRRTASGVPYEPQGFTAAHRSLPFGSVLRVKRLDGGPSVYVRVTDRGPYGPRGRILDLSRAAAEQLGMMRAGVVKIELDVVEYGPPRKSHRRRR